MVASRDLLTTYGAMPADPTKQQAWFDSIDKNFPGIKLDWGVAEGDARLPGHPQPPVLRAGLRRGPKAAMQAFENNSGRQSGLDMDAELAKLQTTLQGIFDKPAN